MPDLLADGLAWLNEKLTDHVSTAWTYRRLANSCTVYLTEGRNKLRVSDGQGNTKIERPDLSGSFSADELILGGSLVEPADGDTLERVFGSVTRKYELTPVNNGMEPSWHYTDPQQERIMIFAKYVGNV